MERRFQCAARVIFNEVNALPSLGFSAPRPSHPQHFRPCKHPQLYMKLYPALHAAYHEHLHFSFKMTAKMIAAFESSRAPPWDALTSL